MNNFVQIKQVTIADGASLSDAAQIDGAMLVGIEMPAAWTTADLTFEASSDNSTFNDMYDQGGTEIQYTAAASYHIALDGPDMMNFLGVRYLKVRSGTTGTPVNQSGAARTVKLLLRPL